jgi:hypothetical protein
MQYRIGEVLGRTFAIFFRSFPKLLLLALPIMSPYVALQVYGYSQVEEGGEPGEAGLIAIFSSYVLLQVLISLLAATATFEVLQRLRGETASLGACLGVGMRRLFPVLIVNLLVILAIGVGLVLFIVPGVILGTMLAVAIPICVVEKPGIFATLNRSSDLTKGNRWGIFATLLLYNSLSMVITMVMMGISMVSVAQDLRLVAVGVETLSTIVMGVFQAVLVGVMYHELRTRKEGSATDELVAVFA